MTRVELQPTAAMFPGPGHYRTARLASGRRTATVACPDCGQSASLSGHTIAANGDVSPSLDCPQAGCGFHEFVTLEGWTP